MWTRIWRAIRTVAAVSGEAYARDGAFDPPRMIALLEHETESALRDGFTALRVTGEMTWALRGLPGSEWLIEYEIALDRFFETHAALALCQVRSPPV